MDVPILKAALRQETGSNAMKKIRETRENIPGVIYGKGKDNEFITVQEVDVYKLLTSKQTVVELKIDGKKDKGKDYAMFKDIQWDTWGEYLLHFDLMRISLGDMVETNVEIILKNAENAVGVKAGGAIEHLKNMVALECPANDIPESIVIDVAELAASDRRLFKDLPIDKKYKLIDNPEELVLICHPPKGEDEIEADAQLQEGMQKEPEVLTEKEQLESNDTEK
ncbi:MAG: 50S ribosomal protein L25 [Planctomycetes bacterium]|nr:50S ribosomal protein L25 [Planctomycetota bacterium]